MVAHADPLTWANLELPLNKHSPLDCLLSPLPTWTCTSNICTRLPASLPEQASLLHWCHRSGLQRTDRLGNEPPRYLCHKLCQHQLHSSMVLHENTPQVSFSSRKHIHAKAMTARSPCGPGKPLDGQPKGWPSVPRMVYSCSMPNQGCWSFTISIILLHVTRRLVSAKADTDQNTCKHTSKTVEKSKTKNTTRT